MIWGEISHLLHVFTIICMTIIGYLLRLLKHVRHEKDILKKQIVHFEYILAVQAILFKAHVQINSFVKALHMIANFYSAKEAFFYVPDEYVLEEKPLWRSNPDNEQAEPDDPPLLMIALEAMKLMQKNNINEKKKDDLIDVGHVYDSNHKDILEEYCSKMKVFEQFNIKNLMIMPIHDHNQNVVGVIGCYDIERYIEDVHFLEQMALSIFRCINNYRGYSSVITKAQCDTLTGLKNQNNYYAMVYELSMAKLESLGCIYIDVNGLHEVNNHLGHRFGDEMLSNIGRILKENFPDDNLFRIGGDEFVVLYVNKSKEGAEEAIKIIEQEMLQYEYEISAGMEWRDDNINVQDIVNTAEKTMQENKKRYYSENKNERQSRMLNEKMEQLIMKKQDMDNFLRVLAPHFTGVYLVDLTQDILLRHIYIPQYFQDILKETNNIYSEAMRLYARKFVMPEHHNKFILATNYVTLEDKLKKNSVVEFVYQKNDEEWFRVQIVIISKEQETVKETMWIFSKTEV